MTREKAIDHLCNKISFCISIDESWADAVSVEVLEMAVNALKKQEPMKVQPHCICPACGKDVVGSGFYCWNCGQHLNWEDDDNGTK